jgi:biopolymer transport protein ExbD
MRRSSRLSKIEMELFPFLSVLACTIGSLILLIIVITTQTLSSNKEITIIAKTEGGQNVRKKPRYIECRKDGIVIYPSQEFIPKHELNNQNSKLFKLISEVKNKKNREYVIVAVRPQGIEIFKQVRNLIEQQEIDIGYEPIEENWQLKIIQ